MSPSESRASTRASKRASKSSRAPSTRTSVSSKRTSTRKSAKMTAVDEPFGITALDTIPGIVSDLRKTFDTDRTRPKSWRKAQLLALKKMLTEQLDHFNEAAHKDLKKSAFEMTVIDVYAAVGEVNFALSHLDGWMADEKRATNVASLPASSLIKKEPLGVVLIIGAWNYNISLSFQPLVGAIAAGNCAVLKPGDFTPHLSEAIARMTTKYMDPLAIRCVTGDHHASTALLQERWDMIFFTGSTRVGKIVAAAAAKNLTPTVLELGGKSPCIVDKSANIEVAARRICWGGFTNSGQTCVRPDYVMVHDDVADELVAAMKTTLLEFYGKDPKKSKWFSRVVHAQAFERVTGMVSADSKYIVHGGKSMDASERYIEPTLLDFGTDMIAFNKAALMQDEIFGPVLPIVRYTALNTQVIPFVRARPKPLSLYVFSENQKVTDTVLGKLSSGGAAVNECMLHILNDHLPFGGVGESGMGSYHGDATFSAFSHSKSVLVKGTSSDNPARYPPISQQTQDETHKALAMLGSYPLDLIAEFFYDRKNVALVVMSLLIVILLVVK
jgi:aldehyde dehydrogenase (NAD+)